MIGLSGCMGDRYHESTGQYIDDSTLTAHVKSALDRDEYKYPDVHVNTYKGVVQLSGFVDNKDEKQHAYTVARGVDGVRQVEDNLSIKPE